MTEVQPSQPVVVEARMTPWGVLNGWIGLWTFVIAVCFILFLLFGSNWIS